MIPLSSGHRNRHFLAADSTAGGAWFSNRTVATLRVERDMVFWDRELRGFGVRVYPNGGKRYVAQAFRRGKTIRVQIGRYEALPFEKAKTRAREAIADIDDGRNPRQLRRDWPSGAQDFAPDHATVDG